jgi:cytosine/adenosine deaminase-related metal-dependent hydrolase
MQHRPVTILQAGAIRDAQGIDARPGALAVKNGRVVASGHPSILPRRLLHDAHVIHLPDSLLLPAMVNAHAHLDLTDIGPHPYDGDFPAWLRFAAQQRPTDPHALTLAVLHGAEMSRAAGVEYLADLAYDPQAIHARRQAMLPGVSYLECFGLGPRQHQQIARLNDQLAQLAFETPCPGHSRGVVLGVSPHAPFTAGPDVYAHATALGREHAYRLCSHVAETPQEIQCLRDATGPLRDLLQQMGVWDDAFKPTGQHPIEYLRPHLLRGRWLLAHCNYVDDDHIDILHHAGASVAYCPIASSYFGHEQHRYREMLEAGVNVCLGTDSILCQPPHEPQPMGILPQMRYLYRRDRTEPLVLLKMATTNGMLALEFSETDATLRKGATAVFSAVHFNPHDDTDPLTQILNSDEPARQIRATRKENETL